MAQPFTTHRPQHEDDEDEAPPPYEATAPAVPAAAIPAHTPHAAPAQPLSQHQYQYQHQQQQQQHYPALTPPHGHVYPHQPACPPAHRPPYQPPPAFGYYPAMGPAPAPAPPSPHAAPHAPYPHYPHYPQYAQYSRYPHHPQFPHFQQPPPPQPQSHFPPQPQYPQYPLYAAPQAYPAMPLHSSSGPALSLPYPSSTAPAPQASAPAASASGPATDGAQPSPTLVPPTVQAPEHNLIDFAEDVPSQSSTAPTPTDAAVPATSSGPIPGSSSPPPPPSLAPALVPTTATEGPGLVTHYRCGKCGQALESETSVCKRIHTLGLSLAERQIRQATTADLEKRRKSHDGTVGSVGVGAGPSTDSFSSASSSSTASQQQQQQQQPQSNDVNSPLPHSQTAAYSQQQQQAFWPQQYQQQAGYAYPALTVAGPSNNYGTNDTYLRRAASLNPVLSLKNLWRELNQTPEYVRPGVLVHPVSVPPPGPVMYNASHLGRSNTISGPTYAPPPPPPPPMVVPPPPMQPWLAPSAPPRQTS
ncbi:hypothetical protein BGZ68_001404 [Mortierella alpina]|nr:hypothetical protein BGZ68_001404 [Mortierella alpina]